MNNTHFPVAGLENPAVSDCTNLRRTPAGSLSGMGAPATVSPAPTVSSRIYLISGGIYERLDGYKAMFIHRNGALYAEGFGHSVRLADMAKSPESVSILSDGVIVFPKAPGAPRRFVCGAEAASWQESPLFPTPPLLTLERVDAAAIFIDTAPLTLAGPYTSRSTRLTDDDAAALRPMLANAYSELCHMARVDGRWVQPVVARYRLIGPDDAVLYESAPVIIAPASGQQLSQALLTLSGSDLRTVQSARLSCTPFSIKVRCVGAPGEVEASCVKRIEILASPQLHNFDPDRTPVTHLGEYSAVTPSMRLTAWYPGVSDRLAPAAEGTFLRAAVEAVLDSADTSLTPVDNHIVRRVADELTILRRLVASRPAAPSEAERLLHAVNAPHSFTAASVCPHGDTVAYGGITPVPFSGYSVPELTVTTAALSGGETHCSSAACVELADGSRLVNRADIQGRSPSAYSPLIAYPLGEAVRITLRSGGAATAFTLASTRSGRWAYHLNPTLLPLPSSTLAATQIPAASTLAPRSRFEGVGTALATSPLRLDAATLCGVGSLAAILPAVGGTATLDSAAKHFHAFGSKGTALLTLNSLRTRLSASLIDPRPVLSPSAVALTPRGAAAIAGGDLLMLSGRRSNRLLPRSVPIPPDAAVLYSAANDEVTLLAASSPSLSLSLASGHISHRTLPAAQSTLSTTAGATFFAAEADGAVLTLDSEAAPSTPVTLSHACRAPAPRSGSCRALLGFSDEVCHLSFATDHGLPASPFITHSFTVTGTPRLPLTFNIPTSGASHITRSISLSTRSPDTFHIYE